jgi:hypothetical protein
VRGKWLDHTVYSMLDHEYDKHRAVIAEIVDGVGLPIEDA